MFRFYRSIVLLTLASQAAACGDNEGEVTLYRNSPIDRQMRVHWATFDASDGLAYNFDNCSMAARLMNANMEASAEKEGLDPHSGVGFWCEMGSFEEEGSIPSYFVGAFPTDI